MCLLCGSPGQCGDSVVTERHQLETQHGRCVCCNVMMVTLGCIFAFDRFIIKTNEIVNIDVFVCEDQWRH